METKVCSKCNVEKQITDFYKKINYCKICHLEKKQNWRKDNPEEYKKQNKNYWDRTKDVQSQKKKVWIKNNREKYTSYWTKRKNSDPDFKLLMNNYIIVIKNRKNNFF